MSISSIHDASPARQALIDRIIGSGLATLALTMFITSTVHLRSLHPGACMSRWSPFRSPPRSPSLITCIATIHEDVPAPLRSGR